MCGISVVVNGCKVICDVNNSAEHNIISHKPDEKHNHSLEGAAADEVTAAAQLVATWTNKTVATTVLQQDLREALLARGPDKVELTTVRLSHGVEVMLWGSILHLRGYEAVLPKQPMADEDGNILIWNGEVFQGLNIEQEIAHNNDTTIILAALRQVDNPMDVLNQLEGPGAFVYWQARTQTLWYGRDPLGRRSLVTTLLRDDAQEGQPSCIISSRCVTIPYSTHTSAASASSSQAKFASVQREARADCEVKETEDFGSWRELATTGIFSLNFSRVASHTTPCAYVQHYPWPHVLQAFPDTPSELPSNLHCCPHIPREVMPFSRTIAVDILSDGAPPSTSTSDTRTESMITERASPQERMSFAKRIKAVEAGICSEQPVIPRPPVAEQFISSPLQESINNVFLHMLSQAVRDRVLSICQTPSQTHARVTVLFSGGIDCMVLAALADKHLPPGEPIDLVNVAFCGDFKSAAELSRRVPDRVTAINGVLELQAINPDRHFRLIEVNVTLDELKASRQHVMSLIHPSATVMDFNIGSIMWFGARAEGLVRNDGYQHHEGISSDFCRYNHIPTTEEDKKKPSNVVIGNASSQSVDSKQDEDANSYHAYRSRSRVVLIGIGADEQLAGYARHRTVFRRSGWIGLQQEVNRDFNRLWRRNLGRDDRIIADSGREARHPFLAEPFVRFINSIPLSAICNLSEPLGIGDKKILRCAAIALGIGKACGLQKRAIQFGSRIANKRVAGFAPLDASVKLEDMVNPIFVDKIARNMDDALNPRLCKKKIKRERQHKSSKQS